MGSMGDIIMAIKILFGRYLVRNNIITEEQLTNAINIQHELNAIPSEMMELGYIHFTQFLQIRKHQRQFGKTFITAIVELDIIEPTQLNDYLTQCIDNNIKLGEIFIKQGVLGKQQLDDLLEDFNKSKSF